MKSALAVIFLFGATTTAANSAEIVSFPKKDWSWQGVFGTYDRSQLQRGLQAYKSVCAACHGLKFIAFRDLLDLGYSAAEIKAFAKTIEVTNTEPNDEGEIFKRPARAADYFPDPFPNKQAARAANNGAYPPDLSLVVESRVGGANYLHALLTGYADPPKGVKLGDGMYYNKAYPGHQIAMPAPIMDDSVEYKDGTKPTVNQIATDVTAFLAWASEPNMEARKSMGIKVMLFLFAFLFVLIGMKRRTWSNVH
jgi:ubiquinol-cytochrome c reductase cytochrome c1 subunit